MKHREKKLDRERLRFYNINEDVGRFFEKLIVFFLVGLAHGQGIGINYRDFTFIDVKLGVPVELKPALVVENRGELERKVELRVFGLRDEYYEPIISSGFLVFPSSFYLLPGEQKELQIYFFAPSETRNYNRKWIAGLEIESKASEWEPISISALVSLRIETESNYIPDQMIQVAPSIIRVTDTIFYFWLANLTFVPETLEVMISPPYPADFIQRAIGYNRTVQIVKLDRRQFYIKEGERIKVSGRIKLPPTYAGDKIENIILVWNKRLNEKGFIRVFFEGQGGVKNER